MERRRVPKASRKVSSYISFSQLSTTFEIRAPEVTNKIFLAIIVFIKVLACTYTSGKNKQHNL